MKSSDYQRKESIDTACLDDIQQSRSVRRLRFNALLNPSKEEVGLCPFTTTVSFVPMEAVGEYGGICRDQTKLLEEVYNGYTYFRSGDVLVAKITPCFENGKGALAEELENGIGFGSTEFHVLRPRDNLDARYLFYVTISHRFRNTGEAEMKGAAGQKRVPEDFIKDFRQPLPCFEKQRGIANFLDRETSRIDTLIAKKERQIELLQEKRTAVISHAVTKGLDPNVKMKDSGIDWLGEIPEHWEARRTKLLATKIGSGKTPRGGSEVYVDSGVVLLRSQNIHFDEIRLKDVVFIDHDTDSEMASSRVQDKDVLLNITGASLGRCNIAKGEVLPANVNQHVCIIRPKAGLVFPKYLWFSICSNLVQSQIFSNEMGTSREGLNFQQVGNLVLTMPDTHKEQVNIAAFLDQETVRLDELISKVRSSIEKLREYRTALISAAVTGKIDVRGETA